MTEEEITFSLPNLQLLRKAKEHTLKQLQSQKNDAINEASIIINLPDPNMAWAWMQPLMANLKSEDDAKAFAKLIVAIYRFITAINIAQNEILAIDMVADEQGPFTLASVSFNGMEVVNGEPKGSSGES